MYTLDSERVVKIILLKFEIYDPYRKHCYMYFKNLNQMYEFIEIIKLIYNKRFTYEYQILNIN